MGWSAWYHYGHCNRVVSLIDDVEKDQKDDIGLFNVQPDSPHTRPLTTPMDTIPEASPRPSDDVRHQAPVPQRSRRMTTQGQVRSVSQARESSVTGLERQSSDVTQTLPSSPPDSGAVAPFQHPAAAPTSSPAPDPTTTTSTSTQPPQEPVPDPSMLERARTSIENTLNDAGAVPTHGTGTHKQASSPKLEPVVAAPVM